VPERSLRSILSLDQVDDSLFRSLDTTERPSRTYGGTFMGQAVMAAGRTVPGDRPIHSAHAHFLRPGDSSAPMTYEVHRLRDGGAYSTRRVEAAQGRGVIFTLTASFHRGDATELNHQGPHLRVPSPAQTPSPASAFAHDPELREWCRHLSSWLGVDLRFPEPPARATARESSSGDRQSVWIRVQDALGDAPLLHAAALAYCSDLLLLSTGLAPHGMTFAGGDLQFASIDHAIWFHQSVRADQWFLHDMQALWNGHGRSLSRGDIFDERGRLAATTSQEGVIRPTSTPR